MSDQVGVFNRLGSNVAAGTTASVEYEFLEGSQIGLSENFISTNGLRGTRAHVADRIRKGTRQVNGTLRFAPTPAELSNLLPMILGGTPSGLTYPLAETLPVTEWIAVRDGTTYHYSSTKVNAATFRASEGGPLELEMEVIGVDEILEGAIGANTIDASTLGPFTLMDATATVGGVTYQFSAFEMRIENAIEVKYRNSLTPTQLKATDRVITVSLPFSLGDAAALYGSAVGGVTVVVTFANGGAGGGAAGVSLAFSLVAVQAPRMELPFGQRGILDLPWRGTARKSGATLELVTTLDITP